VKNLYLKDSSFGHCIYSNNPTPAVTYSKHVNWVRDGKGKPEETVYTDMHLAECNGGIGWLIEPYGIMPHAYEYVKNNAFKFKEIWTHDASMLYLPNAKLVPIGGCWIESKDYGVHEKTKMFSIIASSKRQLQGHQLRHNIIRAAGSHIDAFGPAYTPFKKHSMNKIEGLKDYRYHFVIENCKRDFYFSEKLIDSLITGTMPIYWGCPSIGSYFNTDGFIIFDTIEELKEKLKLCTPAYYDSKKKAIMDNFQRAQKYLLAEDWMVENRVIKS
jgi:hypothetical protein